MTRRLLVASVVAMGAAASVPAQQQPPSLPQVFRTATDVVQVDVQVRVGSDPVGGLRAQDFQVLDNGVPQRIEIVERTAVPVDVTAIVDVSGQTSGVWMEPESRAQATERVAGDIREIAAMLRAGDRLRVLAIDTYVEPVVSLQAAAATLSWTLPAHGGLASVHDAIATALLQPIDPGRRHFIFVKTKAVDTMSVLDQSVLGDLAGRTDAVLYVVQDDASLLSENSIQDCHCELLQVCQPTRRLWLPIRRRSPERCFGTFSRQPRLGAALLPVLDNAARNTGGAFYTPGFLANRTLSETFRDAFDSYRSGYLLRYTSTGEPREGRHELQVTVPGRPEYVVTARRSYWVEPARPVSTAAVASRTDGEALDVAPIAEAFARGDLVAVQQRVVAAGDVAGLVRRVRSEPRLLPYGSRLDSMFALELSRIGLRSGSAADSESVRLLADHNTLVRHPLGADEFECGWYQTEIAALTGLVRPDIAKPFLDRALTRCTNSPRLYLAKAILADQRWPVGTTAVTPGAGVVWNPSADHRREVTSAYEQAMAHPAVAAEARVRLAWFLSRTGEHERALALIAAAMPRPEDRYVAFIKTLIEGHILRALGRHDEAVAAYRRALGIVPDAQSARVAMMTLFLERGDAAGASALSMAVETAPEAAWDPWWQYWQGDLRAYGEMMTALWRMTP